MNKNNKITRLWGKRLEKAPSPLAEVFTSGRDVHGKPAIDDILIPYDIWGSRAHAVMLAEQRIIPRSIAGDLLRGLKKIEGSWRQGRFHLESDKEDVHSNIESCLIKKLGIDAGGRLHTARSRNDQIALDMRLIIRDYCLQFVSALISLMEALLDRSYRERDTIIPGYTHHQPAQITTLGHTWLSFAESLVRDAGRFQDWFSRFNRNPLGSMTGYGTSFNIDRKLTSRLLGFDGPCPNSLDPIQNRWEPESEMGFAITIMMNHLSSLAQILILFSTGEFGLIRLDDAYCSGSSMMPQKRNPDPLEIIKAKAAVVQGHLVSLTSIGRSLFLGYNRDTQWTKYLIIDLSEETLPAIAVMKEIIQSLTVNTDHASALAAKGFIGTPDLVERMVQEGNVSFRQAKMAVEKAVRYSEAEGLDQVSIRALKRGLKEEGLQLKIGEKMLLEGQDARSIVLRRKAIGGNSPSSLMRNRKSLQQETQRLKEWVLKKRKEKSGAKARLEIMEKKIRENSSPQGLSRE